MKFTQASLDSDIAVLTIQDRITPISVTSGQILQLAQALAICNKALTQIAAGDEEHAQEIAAAALKEVNEI